MTEKELIRIMIDRQLTILTGDLSQKTDSLIKALEICCPPQSASDRTCYMRLCIWLHKKVASKAIDTKFDYARMIQLAIEASGPTVKNPMACLMAGLKKTFAYLG